MADSWFGKIAKVIAKTVQRAAEAVADRVEAAVERVVEAADRVAAVVENTLNRVTGEDPDEIEYLEDENELPNNADPRKAFLEPEDAENYASEIPVPTVIVKIPIPSDDSDDSDSGEEYMYRVYVVYEDDLYESGQEEST
ncbi:MAG: hypothetical protein D6823_12565 [Chloroflexi bacterium]|nr:MAG: hypothetical protein D6823_12565 [Chloroflexota bacterium]